MVVRSDDGHYWTPNGNHRLAAMRTLGARAAVAIVVPEPEVAHRILLRNTEKAHNLRERAIEVARLAQALAELDDRPERQFEIEFEEAAALDPRSVLSGERPLRRKRVPPSPYLRAFVVARINPLRFQRGAKAEFDETIDKMLASARRFDPARIKADQVARASGAADESASG